MLRFGKITEVNPEKCYARVTFSDDGIVSAELQILVRAAIVDKDSFTFEINEQVAVLMDEDSEEGVILGAVFNDSTNPPGGGGSGIFKMVFGDQSSIEYDRNAHTYKINVEGDVEIKATGTASVEGATVNVDAQAVNIDAEIATITATAVNVDGETILTGNLTITGNVTATGAISSATSIAAPSISGPGVTMLGGNLAASGELSGATVKAGTVDLGTHVHAGVTTGSGSTAPPTP